MACTLATVSWVAWSMRTILYMFPYLQHQALLNGLTPRLPVGNGIALTVYGQLGKSDSGLSAWATKRRERSRAAAHRVSAGLLTEISRSEIISFVQGWDERKTSALR